METMKENVVLNTHTLSLNLNYSFGLIKIMHENKNFQLTETNSFEAFPLYRETFHKI